MQFYEGFGCIIVKMYALKNVCNTKKAGLS